MGEPVEKARDMASFLLTSGVHRNFAAWSQLNYYVPRNDATKVQIWRLYSRLVRDCSGKSLTYQSDALNATKAIFTKLQEAGIYRTGFHWGLPLDGFDEALTWSPASGFTLIRREGFPSWSWLGWKGPIFSGPAYQRDHATQQVFSAWKVSDNQFSRLFPDPMLDRMAQAPVALLKEPNSSPWLSSLSPDEASRVLITKGYVLNLPMREPISYDANSTTGRLFGNLAELLAGNTERPLNILAPRIDEAENLYALRLNAPKPGGMHAFLLLDQVRNVGDADDSLGAVYGGWFHWDLRRDGDLPFFIENEMAVNQELRTVFLL
jgi:hypothetical protein